MTPQITTWINAKLEYISGAICGVSVITFDIPSTILKIVMAVVLGAAGAFGSHLTKLAISKIRKRYGKV